MSSLPALQDWETTRDSLHKAAQVVSTIAKTGRKRDEKFFRHLSLEVVPEGLTAGWSELGRLTLNFHSQTIFHRAPDGVDASNTLLAPHNQVTLTDALLHTLRRANLTIEIDREGLQDESPFIINPERAFEFGDLLNKMNTVIQEGINQLAGFKLPPVVFPHHFDLSALWFKTAADSEHAPHVNFGFAPSSDGLPRPYFYAYLWAGEAYHPLEVQAPFIKHEALPHGVIIPYDDLRQLDDPLGTIQNAIGQISAQAEPFLGS